jgi:hypothetical protein
MNVKRSLGLDVGNTLKKLWMAFLRNSYVNVSYLTK